MTAAVGCADRGVRPQLSIAVDRRTGRVEEAWNDPRNKASRLSVHPSLQETSGGAESEQHTALLAVSALLWSRGFEPAAQVRPEINVDTYLVAVDGGLEPVSMCVRCRVLLPDVTDDGSSPVPIVDLEHVQAVMTALVTPVDYLPRVPPARFGHGDLEDPRTPAELRRLVDAVETERGNTAMVLTGRDPDLAPETALDAMLANPPAALWPGTLREEGGGFRTWPDCATCAELDEIDRATARVALGDAISLDLAYDSERIERARAGEFADAILAFVGPAARWWTNTRGRGTGWLPLTSATFDRGVLGVDQDRILVAWVLDED